jgi:hypothetical protein
MTPRSPHRQHHKSTTISQRLRNRADQHLPIQPSEIPRLKSVRPGRAPTPPEPHHEPLHTRSQTSPQSFREWNIADRAPESHISGVSDPVQVGAHHQSVDILAQRLETSPLDSLQDAVPNLVSTGSPTSTHFQQLQYSAPGLSTTLPTSVPDTLHFEVPLATTDPRQLHNPYIDLQDMR